MIARVQLRMTHSSTLRSAAVAAGLGLAAVFAGAGCTQVQVAPDVAGEYKLGELQVFSEHNFAVTYEAAKRGLKDMGLFQTRDDRKPIEAELNGRDGADTLVIVKIKEVAPNRTSVKIRYGLAGNLALAQKLYQAIERHY